MGLSEVSASHGLSDEIAALVLPSWPTQPRLEAREDGRNEVTIVMARCHPHEGWHLVHLRSDALYAIAYATSGPPAVLSFGRTNYDMVVRVPPHRLETFQVVTRATEHTEE
jgi:hypothetical protein